MDHINACDANKFSMITANDQQIGCRQAQIMLQKSITENCRQVQF